MISQRYSWDTAQPIDDATLRLASELGVSPILARLLRNRGYGTTEAARAFLELDTLRLEDPGQMAGMSEAVSAISGALDREARILVYGDYDVDGICAASLMVSFLRAAGGRAEAYIPHRLDEGYGLNAAALTEAKGRGVDLVLTVDCGVSAVEEAALSASLGLELVITDHHEPRPELPAARAVINPRRSDCSYPNKNLAGVGVALKLAQGLAGAFEQAGRPSPPGGWAGFALSFCDLVALGSVADVVPLTGENRSLVRLGLDQMTRSSRPGARALLEAAGHGGGPVTEYHLGFLLAPRLNACGRMGRLPPDTGLALLTSADPVEATGLAVALDRENRERRKEEAGLLGQALAVLERQGSDGAFLVVDGDGWHPGVLGIVAARLVDRFGRPAAVISWQGAAEGRGSCRAPAGFHLPSMLSECADLLCQFGGHAGAAGLTVTRECFPDLKERLNRLALEVAGPRLEAPVLSPDVELEAGGITLDLAESLGAMAPFGPGNPQPLFLTRGLKVAESRRIGRGQEHLKLRLSGRPGTAFEAVAFRCWLERDPGAGEVVDLLFGLEVDAWNGRRQPKAVIKDLGSSEVELRYQELSAAAPGRETLAGLYRRLRGAYGDGKTIAQPELFSSFGQYPRVTLQAALAVFSELGLIHQAGDGWRLEPNPQKTALENSAEYIKRCRQLEEFVASEPYVNKVKDL